MAKKQRKLTDLEISEFMKNLHTMVSSGLPTYEGISILMEDVEDKETLTLLESLYEPMEQGMPLSEALHQSELFPSYAVDMIELGEKTGHLEEVLDALSTYYYRNNSIRETVRHAATYPLIMTFLMIVVLIVLIARVLPVFSSIYEGLGTEITGFGAVLISISNFLNTYMIAVVAIILAIIVICFVIFQTEKGRSIFAKTRLAEEIAAGTFANSMYLVLSSGLDTNYGFEFAKRVVTNPVVLERINEAERLSMDGATFYDAIFETKLLDKTYSSWIRIGDTTGNMDQAMELIAESYDERTSDSIDRIVSSIEPVLVITLSVIIGLILISFMLPLLAIMTSIG